MPTITWDANFEIQPADTDEEKYGANEIRQLKVAISERMELEHNFDAGTSPSHKAGYCAVTYIGTANDIANLANSANGCVAYDTGLTNLKIKTANGWVEVVPTNPTVPGNFTANGNATFNVVPTVGAANADPANANDLARKAYVDAQVANATARVAILRHVLASGANGGAAANATWTTRALNTEVYDPGNLVTLASNVMTFAFGKKYLLRVDAIFCQTGLTRLRFFNQTANAVVDKEGPPVKVLDGTFSDVGQAVPITALLDLSNEANDANVVLQYYINNTASYDYELGRAYGMTGVNEVFTSIEVLVVG